MKQFALLASALLLLVSCEKGIFDTEKQKDNTKHTKVSAVNLGLSVKWANCNLGASKPEEYGDYYAWGDTDLYYESIDSQSGITIWKKGKENGFNWKNYKWCNGSSKSLTKYNYNFLYGIVDHKNMLDNEDDAARVKLGGKWRIPTDDEWKEPIDNCDWSWTKQKGVNGLLMTSKINGASIFLPATSTQSTTDFSATGKVGEYWCSSLCGFNASTAGSTNFSSSGIF